MVNAPVALKNVEVIIENELHESDSSSKMRTLESFMSNLANLTLISSDSSEELLDNENCDDYNIIINLKALKRELKKIFDIKNTTKI